jgi:hypothetical protein
VLPLLHLQVQRLLVPAATQQQHSTPLSDAVYAEPYQAYPSQPLHRQQPASWYDASIMRSCRHAL